MKAQFQPLQGSTISAASQYLIHTSIRTSTLMISCSIRPRRDIALVKYCKTPARDRVIEFGKHKGKMLGTLPSTYLKWVSNNLRAGDFQEWANMANQVLNDPIYRDRIEWEFAHKVLNGDRILPSEDDVVDGAVAELLEISERFGWDNEDKVGWSNIDFGLLGTSKGARIPRRLQENIGGKLGNGTEGRELNLRKLNHNEEEEEEEEATSGGETRRDMRRERLKLKMRGGLRMEKTGTSLIGFGRKCNEENNQVMFERRRRNQEEEEDRTVENCRRSRFPGRQSLLNKVLNSRSIATNRKRSAKQ